MKITLTGNKQNKGRRGVPGSPGTLSIRFFKCIRNNWDELALPYLTNVFKFHLHDVDVDLEHGVIQIVSETNEIAENLTLAFSVALLHVLCQPRPLTPEGTGATANSGTPIRGSKEIKHIPSEDLGLVVAAGYTEKNAK